jgi:hypothetical protein
VTDFAAVRAVLRRVYESVPVGGPKVEVEFALDPRFQTEVAAAADHLDRLATMPADMLGQLDERHADAFWGILGPFLVLDGCRFASSAYGPLCRAAEAHVLSWYENTTAGLDRLSELCRYESGRLGAAAVVCRVLPLTRVLADEASDAAWYSGGVAGLDVGADLRELRAEIEGAAATLGLFETAGEEAP